MKTAEIREWTLTVFEFAVAAGYVVPPWRPSDDQADRLTGYYEAGLTPAEAAEAAFAVRH